MGNTFVSHTCRYAILSRTIIFSITDDIPYSSVVILEITILLTTLCICTYES